MLYFMILTGGFSYGLDVMNMLSIDLELELI